MPLLVAIVVVVALLLWSRKATAANVPVSSVRPSPSVPSPTINAAATGPGDSVSAQSDALDNMAQGIAQFEGYPLTGSLANRTNNPGNIGTYGGNVASYSDAGDGWDALNSYITTKAQANPEWDFYDFSRYYLTGDTQGQAGPNQNPDAYAEYIANYMGVDPTQTVSSVLQGS
jgi:hypothetical protein